ncbi:MAG: ribonuclease H [Desulfuromonas sp.]|nr:ribonuclease H [Desulfuromonas sp.]
MPDLILLSDGSVNNQMKVGYGAYLAVSKCNLTLAELKRDVKVRRFTPTSSTKLEVQTLLWALEAIHSDGEFQAMDDKLIIYTDCQAIISLPARRERLENNGYRSKKNSLLNNYELYQEFFRQTDLLDYDLVKVRGHQVTHRKEFIDQLFTLVDRASRHALREETRKT